MIWSGDFISGQGGGASESLVQTGAIIDGKYEVVAFVGAGGMGSVYKARHTEMGNYVALKFLHPRFATDPDAVKRFQREAQIISALRHKNILSVYAFGRYRSMLYIAVEYIEGTSLHWLISDQGKIDVSLAMPVFLQICQAMEYAHHNDVLHRDLKPDNVILLPGQVETTGSGTVKVVDFGLAKLLDGSDVQKLTKTGEVVGDPNYMSPEQCQGRPLDARSDIYSMGCLMYECLSGQAPFVSDSPVATLYRHVSEQPDRFAQRSGVPPALESITLTCMDKKPDNRYESFAALAEALQSFQQNPQLKTRAPRAVAAFGRFPKRQALIVYSVAFLILAGGIGAALYNSTLSGRDSGNADSELLAVARERLRQYDFKLSKGREVNKRDSMQAIKLAEELGDTNAMARATIALADSYATEHQSDRAYQVVMKAVNLPRLSEATRKHLDAKVATFAYASGNWQEAERLYEPILADLRRQNAANQLGSGPVQSVMLCLVDAKFRLKKDAEARALLSELHNMPYQQDGRLNYYFIRLLEIDIGNGMDEQANALVKGLLSAQITDNDKLDGLANASFFYAVNRRLPQSVATNKEIVALATESKHAKEFPHADEVIAMFRARQADKWDVVLQTGEELQSLENSKKTHWPRVVWAITYSEAMTRHKFPKDEARRPLELLNIDLHNNWKW